MPLGYTLEKKKISFFGTKDGIILDVGGGAVNNATVHSLENITLRWMVHEIMKSQCGILFDDVALSEAAIPPLVFPGQPSNAETQLDAVDVMEPIYDELKLNPLWWILEVIPLIYTWQGADGVWHSTLRSVECCEEFSSMMC